MNATPIPRDQVTYLTDEGPTLATERDALDAISAGAGSERDTVVVPVGRLDPGFFDLATGIAGDFMRKFVQYRTRLVVLGDIATQIASSKALHDFVFETNRGDDVWFVPDLAALDARLTGR